MRASALPKTVLPSPGLGRVGVHDFAFEACSGFTRVTARRFAQAPKAPFIAGLRPGQSPIQAACQLPGQPTIARVGLSPTRSSRPGRAHPSQTKEIQGEGAWISLDSFVRIGTYQWVTANPNEKCSSQAGRGEVDGTEVLASVSSPRTRRSRVLARTSISNRRAGGFPEAVLCPTTPGCPRSRA